MCEKCNKDYKSIEVTITDKNNKYVYCPNCLLLEFYNGNENNLENSDDFICDVINLRGAIHYNSQGEEYFLEKEILLRLINRNLTPNEYFALVKKYGQYKYMLHDDFYYYETGEALQPTTDD